MSSGAVRRYKELADRNTEAVRRMREHDRSVSDELRKKLGDADQALAEAIARERVSKVSVRLHWESAAEALWGERWLRIGSQPEPLPPTHDLAPDAADTADAEVGRTYDALRDALRKAGLLPRRNRSEPEH
ncbi:MAG TPA: hypothetical protein VFX16_11825 [Pseudonocardiaceae bacterium]|nr:hypothetical protein [Pseudonocardiaceae bacterium]